MPAPHMREEEQMKAHAKAVATIVLANVLCFGSLASASPIAISTSFCPAPRPSRSHGISSDVRCLKWLIDMWTDDERVGGTVSDITGYDGLNADDASDLMLPASLNRPDASFETASSPSPTELVVVPEPASLLLVGSGAIGVMGRRVTKRHRRRR
jgi:hypothetical protein